MEKKVLTEELKKKWVEALRSGEYKQTHGVLCSPSGYCCLGVLAKIDGVLEMDGEGNGSFGNCEDELLNVEDADYEAITYHYIEYNQQNKLSDMNDNGTPFNEIADWIEENL